MKRPIKIKIFNKKFSLTKKCLILLGAIVLLITTISLTFGRFVYNEIKEHYLYSKNFYFESDKLTDNYTKYEITNWSGVDSYSIVINMNSFKNNNIYASSDISYDISYTCSTKAICSVSKTSGIIYTSTHTDYFTVTITPRPDITFEDGDEVWISVYANATSPYTKSLSAKFTLEIGKIGLSYAITDSANSPYLNLNITNTLDYYVVRTAFNSYSVGNKIDIPTYMALSNDNKQKCASTIVTISFNPNVILMDMTTNSLLDATTTTTTTINSYQYINGISFKVDALASGIVKFYKINPSMNYTYPIVNQNSIISVSYS